MDPPAVGDITEEADALNLEKVKSLASEQHYELVYFCIKSRLISFQREADDDGSYHHEDEYGDQPFHDHIVRINIYWSSGTVGTSFDHPVKGKMQQFRRNVDMEMLGDIFRNPSVLHTGQDPDMDSSGYYETPAAPYTDEYSPDVVVRNGHHHDVVVSAHDNDSHQVVDVLQETNQLLREQLLYSQEIQITGPQGTPVYGTGSFRDGCWILKRGGFWGVELSNTMTQQSTSTSFDDNGSEHHADSRIMMGNIPLSALEDLEIRLGGVIYATATSHDVFAEMEEQDWDGTDRKEVLCHFGGPVTGVWVAIRIDGWEQSHYSVIQKRERSRRLNQYRDNLDVYEILLEEVPDLYPDATISFHRLSFFGECVQQMVDNLGLALAPPQSQLEKGQEEEDTWNIANLIVSELRAAGNDDIGETFMKRVNDLQMATFMMITINNESNEDVEKEIPTLVQMQLASKSTNEFLSEVQSGYGISSLPGS